MANRPTAYRSGPSADELSPHSFDSLAQSRSRSTRAASLALPTTINVNLLADEHHQQQQHQQHQQQQPQQPQSQSTEFQQFKLAPPSTSTIGIRRHSSHHCQIIDKVSEEQMRLRTLPVLPPAPLAQQPVVVYHAARPAAVDQPPPVPKRNFKRSASSHAQQQQQRSPNLMFDTVSEASPTVCIRTTAQQQRNGGGHQSGTARYTTTTNYTTTSFASVAGASSDDDLLNMDSPVFVDASTTAASRRYNSTNPFLSSVSQRSSSDSNHTQASDAGYHSTSTPSEQRRGPSRPTAPSVEPRIFFGESVDQHLYQRGRFSSVDTQSSLDSGCTDVTKCFSPPSTCDTPTADGAPAVPKRKGQKQQQQPPQKGALPRMPPPAPPARGSNPNSPRVVQGVAHELLGKSRFWRQPQRLTQRQDSNLSSDSYSATYSPGFGGHAAEQPLLPQSLTRRLEHAVRTSAAVAAHNGGSAKSGAAEAAVAYTAKRNGGTMRHASVRQDSTLSSDSVSVTSSPGYNTKLIEAPLIAQSTHDKLHHSTSKKKMMAPTLDVSGSGGGRACEEHSAKQPRQQTATQLRCTIEPPSPLLLSSHQSDRRCGAAQPPLSARLPPAFGGGGLFAEPPPSPLIKSTSTPASLQQYVRFQQAAAAAGAGVVASGDGGGQPPLPAQLYQYQFELNRRKSSSPYVTHPKLNGVRVQKTINIACVVLLIVLSLMYIEMAYNRANKTSAAQRPANSMTTMVSVAQPTTPYVNPTDGDGNPARGVCLPIIVKFCEPFWNFTVFPNFIGHFGQLDAEEELEAFDALVDVQCYELARLFLCAVFVPKCGPLKTTTRAIMPCKILCDEVQYRCGFFLDVFGLNLPTYLGCNILPESTDGDECIGWREVQEARAREREPPCAAFQCDERKRCIPLDWRCDGHADCRDQSDEQDCQQCPDGGIFCGGEFCLKQSLVCDGVVHCPYGQDERNCIRLSGQFGDVGQGLLEVYKPQTLEWTPACVNHWDRNKSPMEVCTMLGYSSVNASRVMMSQPPNAVVSARRDAIADIRFGQKFAALPLAPPPHQQRNLLHSFNQCTNMSNYQMAELTCSNFECGRIRSKQLRQPQRRIVGGSVAAPGDWPFIAAILGGPKEIFYCAGVLISDQWVLTAAHCVGNHTLRDIKDFTIQLGITRRQSYSYYGELVKVRRVIPHPQYNEAVLHDNDIALFQLNTRVAFHEHIQPVCLPAAGMRSLPPGLQCTVIGWGKKGLGKHQALYEPAINEVVVPVLSQSECSDWLGNLNVSDGMICAGYETGGKDACQGDSGGPLMCRDENDRERWFVGGIVSWGVKCAHPRLPGVYANVPRYVPWIQQQMQRYSKY